MLQKTIRLLHTQHREKDFMAEPQVTPNTGEDSLRQGALWVTSVSGLALPLTYLRNIFLGDLDDSGQLAGLFASIVIFLETLRTFALFGGPSVLSQFLPKISEKQDKAGLVVAYGLISFGFAAGGACIILLSPELVIRIFGEQARFDLQVALFVLMPIFLLNQVTLYALSGLLQFRLASLVSQFQLWGMTALLTYAWIFDPSLIEKYGIGAFILMVAFANLIGFCVALSRIISFIGIPRKLFWPLDYWSFSAKVYANTVCAYAYNNIDQIYILAQLGVAELGGYFLVLQLSQLIRFVPQRIAQVMLASFSRLIAEKNTSHLEDLYQRLSRLLTVLSTFLTLPMIFLSDPLVSLFGDWLVGTHKQLILLAVTMNVGCIGNINSNLIVSHKRAGLYLINNLLVAGVQLAVILTLIPTLGVMGAILGRFAGMAVGQIGLFFIVMRRLGESSFPIPRDYMVSQILIIAAAILAWNMEGAAPAWGVAAIAGSALLYLGIVRLGPSELRRLLGRST